MTRRSGLLGLLLLTASHALPADSHEGVTYDRIQLAVSASRVVDNDLSVATLYVERDGKTQPELATAINESMAWALSVARKTPGIKLQTTQYTTWPMHADNGTTITGWRGRQSLRLETPDASALAGLVAALQEKMAVESMGFSVSTARQDALETELTREALEKFGSRANQVAAALGRPGYRLLKLDLGNVGGPPSPVLYRGVMAMADRAMAAPPPVQMEAGEQTMTVSASGLIQLQTAP